ncbi:MAG: hypothetical protein ACLGHN_07875 [Bacteriovoracia bacterium]
MKYLVLLLFFISSHSYGGSCFKKSMHFMMGEKLSGILGDLMYTSETDRKKSLKKLCAERNEMWREERDEVNLMFKEGNEELKRKGDISADRVVGGRTGVHLTDKEICAEVEKVIAKSASCYLPRDYLEDLSNENLFEMGLEELCEKYIPRLKKNNLNCR